MFLLFRFPINQLMATEMARQKVKKLMAYQMEQIVLVNPASSGLVKF